MTTTKTYAIVMSMAVILSIIGFAYSHWSDTIDITGSVKMAHIHMTIKSYKNLTSRDIQKYSNIWSELSADGHTLTITIDGLKPCWFVWIGLATQNQGTLPAQVKPLQYSYEDPYGLKQYFENKTYFYGPYPEETGFGDLEVWGHVKVDNQLKSDGTVDFPTEVPTHAPFIADPGEKVVIWVWIHVLPSTPEDAQGKTITIYITIVDDMAL